MHSVLKLNIITSLRGDGRINLTNLAERYDAAEIRYRSKITSSE